MLNRKKVRERGKIKFSRYFQKLNDGEKVSVVRDLGLSKGRGFPKRIQGRTGTVEGKRGECYIVGITFGKKDKKFIIHPTHLKKLNY